MIDFKAIDEKINQIAMDCFYNNSLAPVNKIILAQKTLLEFLKKQNLILNVEQNSENTTGHC